MALFRVTSLIVLLSSCAPGFDPHSTHRRKHRGRATSCSESSQVSTTGCHVDVIQMSPHCCSVCLSRSCHGNVGTFFEAAIFRRDRTQLGPF